MGKRADELKQVAELVADAARGRSDYRPTLTNGAMADAFDSAMRSIGSDLRCWRGIPKAQEQKGASKATLAHRARRFLCGTEFNSFGHVCNRQRGHAGPHFVDDAQRFGVAR